MRSLLDVRLARQFPAILGPQRGPEAAHSRPSGMCFLAPGLALPY